MYKRKRRARSKTRGSILFLGRKNLVSYFVFLGKKRKKKSMSMTMTMTDAYVYVNAVYAGKNGDQ
jgi:hypothetical protein